MKIVKETILKSKSKSNPIQSNPSWFKPIQAKTKKPTILAKPSIDKAMNRQSPSGWSKPKILRVVHKSVDPDSSTLFFVVKFCSVFCVAKFCKMLRVMQKSGNPVPCSTFCAKFCASATPILPKMVWSIKKMNEKWTKNKKCQKPSQMIQMQKWLFL